MLQAQRAWSRCYLLNDFTVEQLAHAFRTLAGGFTLISPSITDGLLRAIRSAPGADEDRVAPIQSLTVREIDVLRLIAEGYGNCEIAGIIHLAEGTVNNHFSMFLQKTEARDNINAVI